MEPDEEQITEIVKIITAQYLGVDATVSPIEKIAEGLFGYYVSNADPQISQDRLEGLNTDLDELLHRATTKEGEHEDKEAIDNLVQVIREGAAVEYAMVARAIMHMIHHLQQVGMAKESVVMFYPLMIEIYHAAGVYRPFLVSAIEAYRHGSSSSELQAQVLAINALSTTRVVDLLDAITKEMIARSENHYLSGVGSMPLLDPAAFEFLWNEALEYQDEED